MDFIGLPLDIKFNNGITICFMRATILSNPIVLTLPISITRFHAFTNPVGSGYCDNTAGQASNTTVRIYSYNVSGNLGTGWYNSVLCVGYSN